MTLDDLRSALDACRRGGWLAGDVVLVVRELWGEPNAGATEQGQPRDRPETDTGLLCPNCSTLMRHEQRDASGRALRERLAAAERACERLLIQVEHRGESLRACARRRACGQAQLTLLDAVE